MPFALLAARLSVQTKVLYSLLTYFTDCYTCICDADVKDFAAVLRVTPESINRYLKPLKDAGIVDKVKYQGAMFFYVDLEPTEALRAAGLLDSSDK